MVSHSMPALREYREAGLVVDEGRLSHHAEIEEAIDRYLRLNR